MRTGAASAAGVAALALAGCGVGVSSDGDTETDPNDKRAAALECLREEKGVRARLLGRESIQVDGANGPRIRFYLTPGEAEAQQFSGRGEGAEQIKSALLFVRDGSEETLQSTEECLGEL